MRPDSRRYCLAGLALFFLVGTGGNVTAYLDRGGNLVVIGDDLGNNVIICRTDTEYAPTFPDAPEGAYVIFSLDRYWQPDTTVNGKVGWPGDWVSPPTGDSILVSLRGGNDHVRFAMSYATHRLSIHVDGGAGNDILNLIGVSVHGDIQLDGGPGDDHMGCGEGFGSYGYFSVKGGDGNDGFDMSGAGVNRLGNPWKISMGSGDDRLWLRDGVHCYGPAVFDLGPGRDEVLMREDIRFWASFDLRTGAGNDGLTIRDTVFDVALDLSTGTEDDALNMQANRFLGTARLNGGEGEDRFLSDSNDFAFEPPKVAEFEIVGIASWSRYIGLPGLPPFLRKIRLR